MMVVDQGCAFFGGATGHAAHLYCVMRAPALVLPAVPLMLAPASAFAWGCHDL